MTDPEVFQHEVSRTVRDLAMSFPQAEEGTSCVNRAFKAGGKNFAFLGEKSDECSLRLKLSSSIPDVERQISEAGRDWEVGSHGWTMFRFSSDNPPAAADLKIWITESFLLLAPKKVSKLL